MGEIRKPIKKNQKFQVAVYQGFAAITTLQFIGLFVLGKNCLKINQNCLFFPSTDKMNGLFGVLCFSHFPYFWLLFLYNTK